MQNRNCFIFYDNYVMCAEQITHYNYDVTNNNQLTIFFVDGTSIPLDCTSTQFTGFKNWFWQRYALSSTYDILGIA